MAKASRSGQLLFSLSFAWVLAVSVFVAIDSRATARPPIAADGLLSLLGVYLPVLALCVLLLLFLTRHRDPFSWTERFCIDRQTAGKEVIWIFVYLLTTQLILGFVFNTGLHFPGPDMYQQADHRRERSSRGCC